MDMPALVHLTLWYAGGILAAAGFVAEPGWTCAGLLAGLAALIAAPERSRITAIAFPYGLAFGCAGIALGHIGVTRLQSDCRGYLRDGAINTITGTVVEEPAGSTVRVQLHEINAKKCDRPIRVLPPRAKSKFAPHGGAVIRVTGEWWRDAGGGPLDTPDGILLAKSVAPAERSAPMARLRGRAASRIRILFADQAPLAEALLIAQRDGIDPRVKRDFAASGLAHLLAISGTHVALVAAVAVLFAALARLPRVIGLTAGAVVGVLYVLFLGAPYPAVRAAAQIVLVVCARVLQRPSHAAALLAAAAMFILLWDPLALLDVGFQLSFAGLIGLLLWRKPLIARFPDSVPLILRDAVATSIAAAAATTPVAAFHFNQVSLIAVPANLLAIPAVSLAVPAAALALAVDPVAPGAALFLAGGARLLLARLEQIAALAAHAPGGHFFVTRAAVLAAIGALACAMIIARRMDLVNRRVRALVVGATTLAIFFPLVGGIAGDDRGSLEIHAIDVGQGDAIAIRSPRGRWILVDAGPTSERYDAGAARVLPFLLRHGARKLDLLVITHPHLDHFGGVPAVARTLQPDFVLDPDSAPRVESELNEVATAVRKRWLRARPGMRIALDSVVIEVLHPDAASLDGSQDPNDYSVVLRLGYGRFAALLTGDAPSTVEQALIQRFGAQLDVDVLKVGHHGSLTSSSQEWLEATTPAIALISAGRGNRYGHPAPATVRRLEAAGAVVLRTDEEGSISLRAYKDGRVERIRR